MSGVRGARGVSPYSGLPADRFWKSGVVQQDPRFAALYSKKYDIAPTAKIATAGSCFAQHVTRWLKTHGLNFLDLEPAPSRLSIKMSERFQYGVYSCRYGNLYTPAQLLQLAQEALLDRDLSGVAVWKREDGRFVDAFRPAVDPDAFDTAEETLLHRRLHLAAVKRMFKSADVFVFTLGLTEAWLSADGAVVYPTAPGTLAGVYDPGAYKFHNYSVTETMAAMRGAIDLIRSVNPGCRFLLTVSPVPLTATAAEQHILLSTVYSKAVLRAAAGELAEADAGVDYFPSYELITNVAARSAFYNSDLRTVRQEGVNSAMNMFGAAHFPARANAKPVAALATAMADDDDVEDDVVCEEALLEAFAAPTAVAF